MIRTFSFLFHSTTNTIFLVFLFKMQICQARISIWKLFTTMARVNSGQSWKACIEIHKVLWSLPNRASNSWPRTSQTSTTVLPKSCQARFPSQMVDAHQCQYRTRTDKNSSSGDLFFSFLKCSISFWHSCIGWMADVRFKSLLCRMVVAMFIVVSNSNKLLFNKMK